MRRAGIRTASAFAFVTALLLVRVGHPLLASVAGAGLVTAATAFGRGGSALSALGAGVAAALAGGATYAALLHVIAAAYPSAAAVVEHPTVPLAITLVFSMVGLLDARLDADAEVR